MHKLEEWPDQSVVIEAQADPSWQPMPFIEFIVKLHGRCNLSCDYCYMYEMADQSWRAKPSIMTRVIIDRLASQIGEHMRAHPELSTVDVILHGGEPLLAGPELIDFAAATFRAAAPASTTIELSAQTNGLLLSRRVLDVLLKHDIHVGVSLDGGPESHDRHRKYRNGKGSYTAVVKGIDRLRRPPYAELFNGLLCTVDVANDPHEVYESLLALEPREINFLLPHGNWTDLPPAWGGDKGETPYADWLIQIFDTWYLTRPTPVRIDLFENLMNLILGGSSRGEQAGLSPARMVVIETDGSFELVDTLKSSFEGAPATGQGIHTHSFDDLMLHPSIVARQRGLASLCQTCLACPLARVCSGGHYAHRYLTGSGFLNPTVYCADMAKLISHIHAVMLADIIDAQERTGVDTPAPVNG